MRATRSTKGWRSHGSARFCAQRDSIIIKRTGVVQSRLWSAEMLHGPRTGCCAQTTVDDRSCRALVAVICLHDVCFALAPSLNWLPCLSTHTHTHGSPCTCSVCSSIRKSRHNIHRRPKGRRPGGGGGEASRGRDGRWCSSCSSRQGRWRIWQWHGDWGPIPARTIGTGRNHRVSAGRVVGLLLPTRDWLTM